MPKEAFGGDDSGGAAPERRKPELDRFGLSPDANIRDVFWRIMGSYAATKKPGEDLSALEHDRFALMRVAVSVLSGSHGGQTGLSPRFISAYSLMMMLDGGWGDALSTYLEKASERKLNIQRDVADAMKRLLSQERYGKALTEHLASMVRKRDTSAIALSYVAGMDSVPLAQALKKELMIIARGDIGANQLNAIRAISCIKDDEDVRKSLIILLSHWDVEARRAAADVLAGMAGEADVKAAAKKRLQGETDAHVRKALERMAGE